jgi:hypothetical protein
MSDGPHRSLPMPKAWKEFARKGDKEVYGADEVRDAALYALSRDFANEVSGALLRALRNIFDGVGNTLLMRDVALRALDDARRLAAGSVFGSAAVGWCEEYVQAGAFGRDNFHEALGCAIQERGYAGQKQVQEHYLRQSSVRRADGVASRIGDAIDSLNPRDVGRSFSGDAERTKAPRRQKEIDQGVPML